MRFFLPFVTGTIFWEPLKSLNWNVIFILPKVIDLDEWEEEPEDQREAKEGLFRV